MVCGHPALGRSRPARACMPGLGRRTRGCASCAGGRLLCLVVARALLGQPGVCILGGRQRTAGGPRVSENFRLFDITALASALSPSSTSCAETGTRESSWDHFYFKKREKTAFLLSSPLLAPPPLLLHSSQPGPVWVTASLCVPVGGNGWIQLPRSSQELSITCNQEVKGNFGKSIILCLKIDIIEGNNSQPLKASNSK